MKNIGSRVGEILWPALGVYEHYRCYAREQIGAVENGLTMDECEEKCKKGTGF